MDDFIFGTLATDAQRRARVDGLRGGLTHASARQPLDPAPGDPITLTLTAGPAIPARRAWVEWRVDDEGDLATGQRLPMEWVDETWDTLLWGYVRRFQVTLPPQPAGSLLRYRLCAAGLDGESHSADGGAVYTVYIDDDPAPEWAQRAVIYQIFPDRFHPGAGQPWRRPERPSGFYGGTLRGITEQLDYVAGLGASVVWFTPIFASPSHHGYDSTDLFQIEPRLGSAADFRALIDAAHQRGLRVLLDLVPNHWSNEHASFQRAITDPNSPERRWYTFTRYPDQYEAFFGVKSLPQLNLRHPPAREAVLDAVRHWLNFGVDGYRVDYAIGPAVEFWGYFRRATRQARADSWTFGEVVDPPDVQRAFFGGLDGCLDFMLLEALRQSIAFGRWDAARLASFLDRHEGYFPAGYTRPTFLDNHDMNRFLWAAGGDQRRLRLATLCQFTLPGQPVIYYGTEVGLSQQRDVRQPHGGFPEESRLPMLWDAAQDRDLLAFYTALVSLRQSQPALQTGTRRTLAAEGWLLAYVRELPGGPAFEVVLNLSDQPQPLPPGLLDGQFLIGTDPKVADGLRNAQPTLPPLGGAVLRRAG